VGQLLAHAAQLQVLKNSGGGGAGGSSSNLAAAAAGGALGRGSAHGSDADLVMVDAAPPAAGAAGSGGGAGRSSSLSDAAQAGVRPPLSPADPTALAKAMNGCSTGLHMLRAAHSASESASLRPLLCAALPAVLQLQELAGPGLQQLAGEAKSAFVFYKYLPLSGREVGPVAASMLAAGGSDSWSTRAAAMVYLQIFWFRHCYLLEEATMQQLQVRQRRGASVWRGCALRVLRRPLLTLVRSSTVLVCFALLPPPRARAVVCGVAAAGPQG
jgi:hypothetical protein